MYSGLKPQKIRISSFDIVTTEPFLWEEASNEPANAPFFIYVAKLMWLLHINQFSSELEIYISSIKTVDPVKLVFVENLQPKMFY